MTSLSLEGYKGEISKIKGNLGLPETNFQVYEILKFPKKVDLENVIFLLENPVLIQEKLYAIFGELTIVDNMTNKDFVLEFIEQKGDIFYINAELNGKKAVVKIYASEVFLNERIATYKQLQGGGN